MIHTALLTATLFLAAPTTQPATDAAAQAAPATRPASEMISYGDPIPMNKMAPLPLQMVLESPEKFTGRNVWVEGEVAEVCQSSGCWMSITGPGAAETLFIKFTCPVEGRLIPLEAVGRRAVIAGEVIVQQIDEATARHYAEEAGATAEELEAIKGPQKQITMKSPHALVAAE